jgi:GNAT superfamily N-acetyltransferase
MVRRLEQSSRDVTDLLRLLADMHEKWGLALPPLNMGKAAQSMWECEQNGIIFVADRPEGGFAGAIALLEQPYWFSDETFLADKFFYVRQEDRASRVAAELLSAAKKYASILEKPLSIVVWNGEDIERKDAFFERKGLRRVGGVYLRGLDKEEGLEPDVLRE